MAAVMQTRLASRVTRSSTVVVRAQAEQPSRRAALGLFAGAIGAGALFLAPQQASAFKLASQEFTGGLVAGGGNSPKSASAASMEGYTLEGTKKTGISASKKAKLLAKVRAAGEKQAAKTAAK